MSPAAWSVRPPSQRRPVRVQRGQRVVVKAGAGVELVIERELSGAVTVRNRLTGVVIRQWSPKEASGR